MSDTGIDVVAVIRKNAPEPQRSDAIAEINARQDRLEQVEMENERLRVVLQNVKGALLPCPEQGELAMTRKMVDEALASAPAVPSEWQQPAWRPIDTYPKDQGVYRNGTRCWLWHEKFGVVWGFVDDLPSGLRCELYHKPDDERLPLASGVKATKGLRYWMPLAPPVPEPPIAAAPQRGGE